MEQSSFDFERLQGRALRRKRILRLLTYLLLGVWAVVVLFPFYWMLLTSVNDIDSRFEGSKTSGGTINLEKYRGKMGTGLTDAYQLLMQIEGTPCLKVKTGKLELVTLTKHFGGSAKDLTYMGVEVSAEDMQKLGMAVEPKMYNGQLMIKCTKPGVAHITVKAVGGGNRPGTGSVMGGIEITKTFAVIARETGAENGGWL